MKLAVCATHIFQWYLANDRVQCLRCKRKKVCPVRTSQKSEMGDGNQPTIIKLHPEAFGSLTRVTLADWKIIRGSIGQDDLGQLLISVATILTTDRSSATKAILYVINV